MRYRQFFETSVKENRHNKLGQREYYTLLGGNLVTWKNKEQAVVAKI